MLLFPVIGHADVLAAWDVSGVDAAADLSNGNAYRFNATTSNALGRVSGWMTLGSGVNPSTTLGQYGFKVSVADGQSSLDGAIANQHYIQFTLAAVSGYRLDLLSIELSGASTGSGCDNVALMSSVDGFSVGSEMASLTGRQGVTGGLDTDASGWGAPIDLSGTPYQNQTSVIFRLYGWNSSSGSGVTYIRNLTGDDLVINGTIEAIPEPVALGFISMAGIGILIIKRFV